MTGDRYLAGGLARRERPASRGVHFTAKHQACASREHVAFLRLEGPRRASPPAKKAEPVQLAPHSSGSVEACRERVSRLDPPRFGSIMVFGGTPFATSRIPSRCAGGAGAVRLRGRRCSAAGVLRRCGQPAPVLRRQGSRSGPARASLRRARVQVQTRSGKGFAWIGAAGPSAGRVCRRRTRDASRTGASVQRDEFPFTFLCAASDAAAGGLTWTFLRVVLLPFLIHLLSFSVPFRFGSAPAFRRVAADRSLLTPDPLCGQLSWKNILSGSRC